MSASSRFRALAFATLLFAVVPTSRASAQQNLFNVPSSDATARGGVFVQEQINLARRAGTSSTTVDVGLGHGLDIGFDVFDVAFYEPPGHDLPMVLLGNAQAVLDPLPEVRLTFGTQQGVATAHGCTRWAGFGWFSMRFQAREGRGGRYLFGSYAASPGYAGHGHRIGGLVGFELPIVGDHLTLMADWMIGRNDIGVAVVGIQIGIGHESRTQLSFGAQIPSPGSHNAYGGVFELTFIPHGEPRHIPMMPMTGVHRAQHAI